MEQLTADITYYPDCYGNTNHGFRFYEGHLRVKVTRASSDVWFSSLLVKSHMAELQHGWMSSIAKAESYNETFVDTETVKKIKTFIKFNPEVGKRFDKKTGNEAEFENIQDENETKEEVKTNENIQDKNETQEKNNINKIHELKRKSLQSALINQEIQNELKEREMIFNFGPKFENGEQKTFKSSADEFMEHVEDLRKYEIYKHENCSKACAARGCKWVIAVDGLWKLRFPICMWNTQHLYPKEIQDYLPNACTEAPEYSKAFCAKHCKTAEVLGTKLQKAICIFFSFSFFNY